MDCKEIQPVHSEGDQPLDFFGRNDAKAETPVLWLLRVDSLEKTLMLGWEGALSLGPEGPHSLCSDGALPPPTVATLATSKP